MVILAILILKEQFSSCIYCGICGWLCFSRFSFSCCQISLVLVTISPFLRPLSEQFEFSEPLFPYYNILFWFKDLISLPYLSYLFHKFSKLSSKEIFLIFHLKQHVFIYLYSFSTVPVIISLSFFLCSKDTAQSLCNKTHTHCFFVYQ